MENGYGGDGGWGIDTPGLGLKVEGDWMIFHHVSAILEKFWVIGEYVKSFKSYFYSILVFAKYFGLSNI